MIRGFIFLFYSYFSGKKFDVLVVIQILVCMMMVQNEKPCHVLQIYYIVPDYIPVFPLYYLPDFQ